VEETIRSASGIKIGLQAKLDSERGYLADMKTYIKNIKTEFESRIDELTKKKKEVSEKIDLAPEIEKQKQLAARLAEVQERQSLRYEQVRKLQIIKSDIKICAKELEMAKEEQANLVYSVGDRCRDCGSIVTEDSVAFLQSSVDQKNQDVRNRKLQLMGKAMDLKNKYLQVKGDLPEDGDYAADVLKSLSEFKEQEARVKMLASKLEQAEVIDMQIRQERERMSAKLKEVSDTAEARLATCETLEARLKEASEEILSADHRLKTVEVLSDFYGPNGIRPMVIGHYGPYFASLANDFLGDITSGSEEILLSSKKRLASGEIRDKIEISVKQGHDIRAFPSEFCAGETGAIDLALNFAVMKMAAQKAGKAFGFLYFDEITNSLSSALVGRLFDLLKTRFYNKDMTVIVTTHREIPEHYFDSVITAVKAGGVCSIRS
jgi:hypothetical protein